MVDSNTLISISSAIVAVVSAFIAYFSLKQTKKNYIISQTPILMPTFRKNGQKCICDILNTHKSAIAKDVSVCLKGGKLKTIHKKENEFLCPDMRIFPIEVEESVDGASFEINYKNIFGKNVQSKGTIHEMSPGFF